MLFCEKIYFNQYHNQAEKDNNEFILKAHTARRGNLNLIGFGLNIN
jgi:hypothetical protein